MPNEGMRAEAQRYRDWKADGEGGGTDVARTRASQILSGNELSADTVVTMSAWFARHEVDKQGKGFSPGEDGYPSNGRVAWAAWGGDAGKSWSDARSKRIKKAREGRQLISNNEEELLTSMEQEQERAAPDALKRGDFVSWNSSGGRAEGRIDRIERDGTIDVPDSSFTITGTADDPAALITLYRDKEATDRKVGHKFSTLTKIAPIRAEEPEEVKRRAVVSASACSAPRQLTFALLTSGLLSFLSALSTRSRGISALRCLSHDTKAPNFMRLNDGAPFLFNHNPDKVLGVVERAYLDEDKKRAYAKIRFSRSDFAKQYLDDVKDGILRGISFGYSIDEVEQREEGVLATSWTPHELSLVSIPADPTIGIGRSLLSEEPAMPESSQPEDTTITNEAPVEKQETRSAVTTASTPAPAMEEQTPNLEVIRSEAKKAEKDRVAAINALGAQHRMADLAQELIDGDNSIDEARAAFLEKLGTRQVEQPIRSADVTSNDVGLSQKEVKRFSFVRALNYLANPGDQSARRDAEFEIEVGQAASKQYERSSNGIVVPNEVLRRDLNVGTATAGGNLVDDVLLSGSFIDLLRNRLALADAGMTTLTGINGNISIPKQGSSRNCLLGW